MTIETTLLVFLLLAGFYMAWNIGANDVANAMGTSVGSGALSLRQAIMVAALLEFSGAFFFGSHVSETIQRGIVNPDLFSQNPLIFVYGMLAALLASGIWLQIASYFGWPVSTTHSIVGALVGFGMMAGGMEAVYWENVSFIITSWVLSPIVGAILSFFLFTFLRKKIFYADDPTEAAKRLTPFIVFIVFFTLSLILVFHGLKNLHFHATFFQAFVSSTIIALAAAIISYFCVRKIQSPSQSHSESEYSSVEKIFSYLQIISACMMAFAHGANDVANAIGPLSAGIGAIGTTGVMAVKSSVPVWTLALGGFGIVIGLATWGWRVILTIGQKITELTPTRGFAAEFGAALTVAIASRIGLPISTTHTLVGSVIGVGFARGIGALNLSTTRDIVISWLVTVPAGAFLSMGLFYLMV